MYEHKTQALASKATFYKRIGKNLLLAFLILCIALVIGVLGYHYTASLNWWQSLHNAAMILGGMGPILPNNYEMAPVGIIFSSCYALFSGGLFITNIGFILAPAIHRFFHKLHIKEK